MSRRRPLIRSMRALCFVLLIGCGGPESPQVCSNASPIVIAPPTIANPGIVVFEDVRVGATSTTTILLANNGGRPGRFLAYGELGEMNEGYTSIMPDVFSAPALNDSYVVHPGEPFELTLYHRPIDVGPDSGVLQVAVEGTCTRTRVQLEGRGLP